VDRVFEAPERFTALETLVAIYGYAAQIYFDFSGYTDVAIGSAALFGYELPENFAVPYLASNLQEFWRRWHITLSTWLRDYVYKPLGGSRVGRAKTYRNLIVTMLLGGLWHGASWTFVVWGGLHGLALALTRMWQRSRPNDGAQPSVGVRAAARGVLARVATFHFVCFAWIFFRAPTLAHAILAMGQLLRGTWTIEHIAGHAVAIVVLAAILHLIPSQWDVRLRERFVRAPAAVQGLALAAIGIGLHLAVRAAPEPFVYGQF
jgi:alginate O-acetyltransferase complex protein AlgI